MRMPILRFAAGFVALVIAWACWREARLSAQLADARDQLITLQLSVDETLQPKATLSDYLPVSDRKLGEEITTHRATVEYWLSRYSDVMDVGRGDVDADVLLLAANAAYRTSQRDGFDGATAVQQLDGVLQAYASVLKAAPQNVDAAYNYELVARVRDQVAIAAAQAAAKAKAVVDHSQHGGAPPANKEKEDKPQPARVSVRQFDLPQGPTIHGRPGGPPPNTKAEDFEIIAPMEFGDREAQPEATPGGKIQRKG